VEGVHCESLPVLKYRDMKLLMFYVHEWWYKTALKSIPEAPDLERDESAEDAVVIFFHSEADDEGKRDGVIQKFVKNVKWIAGKFSTRHVVLHSFNHLSSSKSSPVFAHALLDEAAERLRRTGYEVTCTPFGYFNEFRMHVAGDSLAKVFKEF
jgi:Archaea-specific editing domain of threonyl-tRNA synthetase